MSKQIPNQRARPEDDSVQFVDAPTLQQLTPMPALIAALRSAFITPPVSPLRHHHSMDAGEGQPEATLLLMPAWRPGRCVGVKIATVFPGASAQGKPAVQATYLLNDGLTGQPQLILDGSMLTARRTAAASGLAASFLARENSATLLMVGAGALAPNLIEAHCSVRPIKKIQVWGRDVNKTQGLVKHWSHCGVDIQCVENLELAAREADIISCATLSEQPLIYGDWLKPGAHLDLVGAFKPNMRECDDHAVARADVYVDTREGTLAEAGDLLQPMASGFFAAEDIVAELAELCSGHHLGRQDSEAVTVYKSVGASLMDLAAAELVLDGLN